MPTLVIWGEKDPYILTGNLIGLERYVPKLTVERIPDATHWVVHEKSGARERADSRIFGGFKINFRAFSMAPSQ